MDQLIARDLI